MDVETGAEIGDFAPEMEAQRVRRIDENIRIIRDNLAEYREHEEEYRTLEENLAAERRERHGPTAIRNLEIFHQESLEEVREAERNVDNAAAELRTTTETRSQYMELQREVTGTMGIELPPFDDENDMSVDDQDDRAFDNGPPLEEHGARIADAMATIGAAVLRWHALGAAYEAAAIDTARDTIMTTSNALRYLVASDDYGGVAAEVPRLTGSQYLVSSTIDITMRVAMSRKLPV